MSQSTDPGTARDSGPPLEIRAAAAYVHALSEALLKYELVGEFFEAHAKHLALQIFNEDQLAGPGAFPSDTSELFYRFISSGLLERVGPGMVRLTPSGKTSLEVFRTNYIVAKDRYRRAFAN